MMLHIAADLSTDASQTSTQTLGAIGAKGSGKSYLAGVIVEELFDVGCPLLVLDPIGNWGQGLRRGADGVSPGLPIVVIGGAYGDIPLDADRGDAIGRFVRERNASAVIDISELSKRKRKDFVADLCEAIFRESRRQKSPFMVVLEEAHLFAPQRLMAGEERMYGAVTDVVRLGRNHGLGVLLLTQRPQSVSKEVFNQIECLFVGSMRGPHERGAVKDWVKEQGVDDQVRDMLADLPKLKAGDFYVWSPSWLERFSKIRVRKKRTYDGSSTPVLGDKTVGAAPLAPIDLGELRALMEAPAEALDEGQRPKGAQKPRADVAALAVQALKDERDQLRRDKATVEVLLKDLVVASRQAARSLGDVHEEFLKAVELPGLTSFLERQDRLDRHAEALGNLVEAVDARLEQIISPPAALSWESNPRAPVCKTKPAAERGSSAVGQPTASYKEDLLAAIVRHGPVTRTVLSLLTGKSLSSSTFAGALRELAEDGLITVDRVAGIVATAQGRKQSTVEPLPTGRALYRFWYDKLAPYDAETFAVIAAGPRAGLTRAEISKATGHSLSSSTFAGSIRTLTKLGLCEIALRRVRLRDETRRLMEL